MGARSSFSCPRCGYQAVVSGGDDCGEAVETTTIACADCRKLYDIPVAWIDLEPARPTPKFRCPQRAKHRIERWQQGRPCPACAAGMRNEGMVMLWD